MVCPIKELRIPESASVLSILVIVSLWNLSLLFVEGKLAKDWLRISRKLLRYLQ